MAKELTREQAARKKAQAAAFMERIGDPERAAEFAGMTLEEYVDGKGLTLRNPCHNRKRRTRMPISSKTDLEDQQDEAIGILEDAYVPEATREELAIAIGKALDVLKDVDEDEDEDEDEDGDGDSDPD